VRPASSGAKNVWDLLPPKGSAALLNKMATHHAQRLALGKQHSSAAAVLCEQRQAGRSKAEKLPTQVQHLVATQLHTIFPALKSNLHLLKWHCALCSSAVYGTDNHDLLLHM
jgi:hypothetical protein